MNRLAATRIREATRPPRFVGLGPVATRGTYSGGLPGHELENQRRYSLLPASDEAETSQTDTDQSQRAGFRDVVRNEGALERGRVSDANAVSVCWDAGRLLEDICNGRIGVEGHVGGGEEHRTNASEASVGHCKAPTEDAYAEYVLNGERRERLVDTELDVCTIEGKGCILSSLSAGPTANDSAGDGQLAEIRGCTRAAGIQIGLTVSRIGDCEIKSVVCEDNGTSAVSTTRGTVARNDAPIRIEGNESRRSCCGK